MVCEVARRSSPPRLRLFARLHPAPCQDTPFNPLPSSCRRARGAVRHRVAFMAYSIHAPPDRLTAASEVYTCAHTLITTSRTHVGEVMSIDTRHVRTSPRLPTITVPHLAPWRTRRRGNFDSFTKAFAAFSSLSLLFALLIHVSVYTKKCEDAFA